MKVGTGGAEVISLSARKALMAEETWNDMQAAIEATFRKLAIPPHKGQEIPYAFVIPDIGRQILVEGGFGPDRHIQNTLPASAEATQREIAGLRKRALELLTALGSLHKPALDALGYRKPPAGDLPTHLRILIASADFAVIPNLPENAGRGSPKKDRAQKIARIVAMHYWRLTGRAPARTNDPVTSQTSGQFVKLLSDIFSILDVRASAGAQTKALRKWQEAPWMVEINRPEGRI